MTDPVCNDFEDDEPTRAAGQAARVLVVEDDSALREMIGARLRREGFDVYEAISGDQALLLLTGMVQYRWPSDDVDLIVMDIRMPGRSGLEVMEILRVADWMTPILLMTAYPDASILAEVERCGVALLGKPFALDDLSRAAIAALAAPAGATRGSRPARVPGMQ
jgi:CheY-like chemotaxis protein